MTPSERLVELVEGMNPRLIRRMRSGFAVMSESQFLPGYCLLLAFPQSEHLNTLQRKARAHFFDDLGLLGDAVLQATDCLRVNYSIYGNLDPFLHAHVVPRYSWEQPEFRSLPPLSYPEEIRNDPTVQWSQRTHNDLQEHIKRCLATILEYHGLHHHSHHHHLDFDSF